MGLTVSSMPVVFYYEPMSLPQLKCVLMLSDQSVIDVLFVYARKHPAEAAYAAHPILLEILMLAMILEEHKELIRLSQTLGGADCIDCQIWWFTKTDIGYINYSRRITLVSILHRIAWCATRERFSNGKTDPKCIN